MHPLPMPSQDNKLSVDIWFSYAKTKHNWFFQTVFDQKAKLLVRGVLVALKVALFAPKWYPSGKRVLFSTFSFLLENCTSSFSKRVLQEGDDKTLVFLLGPIGTMPSLGLDYSHLSVVRILTTEKLRKGNTEW